MREMFIPQTRRLVGKKLLLCDNLSSHLSVEVIEMCREHDIEFVCFPANATDKMQPLDVGVFGPMKSAWRFQLRRYSDYDPTAKLLNKAEFPRMLKELVAALSPVDLLPSAFAKCGISPLNRDKVLERIPTTLRAPEIARHVDGILLKKLEVRRFGDKKKVARGKKIPAGTSHTAVMSSEEEEEEERVRPRKKVAKAKKTIVESSEEEEEEVMMVRPRKNAKRFLSSEDEDEDKEDEDKEDEDKEDEDKEEEDEGEMEEELQDVHGFVVAVYEGQWFPAEICRDQSEVPKGYTKLNYLTIRGSNCFIWGPKPDIMVTLNEDIIMMRLVLEPINNRGHLALKSSDLKSVLARMVVVYLYKIGVLFHLKFILKAFFHFISKIRYR